jgi:phosphomannomutase
MADIEARMRLTCFKAYDIRAKLGADLNEDIAYRIGRRYARHWPLGHGGDVLGGHLTKGLRVN